MSKTLEKLTFYQAKEGDSKTYFDAFTQLFKEDIPMDLGSWANRDYTLPPVYKTLNTRRLSPIPVVPKAGKSSYL